MKQDRILLGHGSGGKLSQELIKQLFIKHFSNDILLAQGDSSIIQISSDLLSFTTDSYVVNPIFFPGGDIGKMAVAGTVNDLAVSGAEPLYLSAAFILEEGLLITDLEKIVKSMALEAKNAGVKIVTGDTKVVEKGHADKVFINTAGVGSLPYDRKHISGGENIKVGDKIILNGSIGNHGMAIMSERNDLKMNTTIESDCASLNSLIKFVLDDSSKVKFMRDATRGGLSSVLSELFLNKDFGIEVWEDLVPIDQNVASMCELLGFDPFHVANEGKVIMVVDKDEAETILRKMKQHPLGTKAAIIGEITKHNAGRGYIKTIIGGKRVIDMLAGEQLPRIC